MQRFFKLLSLCLVFIACSSAQAQQAKPASDTSQKKGFIVTGVITDAVTGKALPAINISVPNYSGALTDDQGKFTIRVPDLRTSLLVTAEGYQAKELPLKGRSNVSTRLYEENYNSAYIPSQESELNRSTNAITRINTDGNWNRSTETPDSYMQGKVAGLTPIMRSGTPNAGALLTLRGYNSLYGTNQPLIIVDGMIFDNSDVGASIIANHFTNPLATIDIRDIESITVIKDAVSTYGTKAANGVILITTNHAKQLATKIDAAVYGGINFRPDNLPVMKSSDYRTYLSDMLKSSGMTPGQVQAQPYMNDDKSNPYYYQYHNETDWQRQVMDNSATNNLFLKVTGGDNIAKYALSIGYMKNAGITKETGLNKYNVRFNGDLNLSKRLVANTNLDFSYYDQNLKDQGFSEINPIFLSLIKAPFMHTNEVSDKGAVSPNIAETDTLGISNPVAAINSGIENTKVYRFFGSVDFKYNLSKVFNLYSLVGVTVNEIREQTFIPRKGIANDTLSNGIADSRMASQVKRLYSLFNDTYIDYDKTLNNIHHLQARLGARFQTYKNEQDYALGYNSATDEFVSVGTGVSLMRKTGGDFGQYNWLNNYLATEYSLLNKYFVSFNLGVDASSRFGSAIPGVLKFGQTNMAVLPSVGAAWVISSENFMAGNKLFDVLKLRGTYGKTGNDDIGNYSSKQLYVSQNLLGLQGLVRSNIGNPALQWETSTKANLGLDAAFLKERVNFSVDIYQNKTDHMLTYEPVNPASGFNYALTNGGAMQTTGVDLSVNARLVNSKSVKWDVGVVASHYINRITKLPGNSALTSFGGATVLTQVGSAANLFYGYKTNGVYSTDADAASHQLYKISNGVLTPFRAGDVRFVDINGDNIIDEKDRQVIGNPNPDFAGGFTNRIQYKGLSLEALFTFSKGNNLYNGVRATLESGSNYYNQLETMVNRWRAPGQVTTVPKAVFGDPMGNSSFSDRWIEDGSFLRMKELSLSYNLPFKSGSFLKSSSIYITGTNLLTFTKYLGYDPEFQPSESILTRGIDIGMEPNYKSIVAGVRIGL